MQGRSRTAPSGKGTHPTGYTDDARGAVVGTVLVVSIIVSLFGLIGLLATGFSFGRILAAWFTFVGLGMLALVGLYGMGGKRRSADQSWIRQPVEQDLEQRLFATQQELTAAIGPKPANCGLMIGASHEAARNLQSWVHELGRNAMTCHRLDLARDWIADNEQMFDYVVVDIAGVGAPAVTDFCRDLRKHGYDLPVILATRFPVQDEIAELPPLLGIQVVPLGKVAVKLAILALTDPYDTPPSADTRRTREGPRSGLQVIHGDRK